MQGRTTAPAASSRVAPCICPEAATACDRRPRSARHGPGRRAPPRRSPATNPPDLAPSSPARGCAGGARPWRRRAPGRRCRLPGHARRWCRDPGPGKASRSSRLVGRYNRGAASRGRASIVPYRPRGFVAECVQQFGAGREATNPEHYVGGMVWLQRRGRANELSNFAGAVAAIASDVSGSGAAGGAMRTAGLDPRAGGAGSLRSDGKART